MVFLQSLFKQPKSEEVVMCSAEKLLEIIRELLNKELPEHSSHHHILFTANTKLERLKSNLAHHRNQSNLHLNLGQYHKEMYDQLAIQISNLQSLVDGFMELSIDVAQMNHRLHFYHEQIQYLHDNFTLAKEGQFSTESNQLFWQALKQDVLAIIRSVI